MPSSYDELAWVSSWQLANLSRQIWAIVIADRPLLMADRAPKRELGPCWRSWGMTHIQPASQCLHQLVMGQPSHIPRLMICSRGRPLEISMQNRLCWGKHGSIISNTRRSTRNAVEAWVWFDTATDVAPACLEV